MSKQEKALLVWLSMEQHGKLKEHALRVGESMVGCVREWVDGLGSGVLPVKDMMCDEVKRNPLILNEESKLVKCDVCGDSFTSDNLFKHPKLPGKRFCSECVEGGRV